MMAADRTRPGPRRRRKVIAALLATVLTLAAGCAGVPSDGPPTDFTRVAEPGNQVRETEPAQGLSPLEVVRGFVNAHARIDQDSKLTAARSFLTASSRSSWQAGPTEVVILTATPRFDLVAGEDDQVQITGTTDGYLDRAGAYVPTSREQYQVTISLVRVDGQWRIQNPPDPLILAASDFNLAFTQRHVYFLNPTSTLVVPDRRWLPNRSLYPVTMADVLIGKLLGGPSDQLGEAVRNSLRGVRLRAPLSAGDDGVLEVDLTGVSALSGTAARALAAQLVYTLRADAANIRILIDGAPLDANQAIWTTSVLGAFDPDGVPGSGAPGAQGYYISDGGAIVNLRGTPIWGAAGSGGLGAQSAAMSAATGALAVVGRGAAGSSVLYIGAPVTQVPMEERLTAVSITPPSFSRAGDEVWTVINGGTAPEVVRLLTAGSRYPVDSANLAGIGAVTGAALSPDGVRLALVAGGKLHLSSVVYAVDPDVATGDNQGSTTATLTTPVMLRSELMVSRVVWADSQNMLVAGADPNSTYRTVWRIGLDGRQRSLLATRGILADVDALAATAGLPTLISSGGRILRLEGDDASGEWITANPEGNNAFGTWPIYPS